MEKGTVLHNHYRNVLISHSFLSPRQCHFVIVLLQIFSSENHAISFISSLIKVSNVVIRQEKIIFLFSFYTRLVFMPYALPGLPVIFRHFTDVLHLVYSMISVS